MAKLIYNKDRFTRVDKWDDNSETYKGILLSTKLNQKNGQDYKLLDAIDIDWDRAWFNPTMSYINSTEDLFNAIEALDNREQVNAISEQLDEVVDSYVTQQQLNEMTMNFQDIIYYGEHLKVDDNNVVSTYDLVSNDELHEFSFGYVTHEYFGSYAYTRVQTDEFVSGKIRELIGGANEAFDTIQEISEWIMDQTTFKEAEFVDTSSNTRYYIYNEETGKYTMVNNEYITTHPTEQYYVVASIREELVNVYDELAYINNERIGNAYWHEEYGIYTYTGILKDIHDLQSTDAIVLNDITNIKSELTTASNYARAAFETSETAYNTANVAYDTANMAYDLASGSNGISYEAYAMAYYAYTVVGFSAYEGYFRPMTDEEKQTIAEGSDVFVYIPDQDYYMPTHYHPSDTVEYYVYVEPVEATGMHKAIDEIRLTANTALYHLNVDNSNSNSYIKLSMAPSSYEGDVSRTLYMNSKMADYSIVDNIIEIGGKQYKLQQYNVESDGLISAYQFNDMLSYVLDIEEIKVI